MVGLMKRNLLIIGTAFAITLAIIFGVRVSADALAVIIGVILGIVASVPATLLVIFMLNRQQHLSDRQLPHISPQPPVIVVTSPNPPQTYSNSIPTLPPPARRSFTIVGQEDTD